MDRSTLTAKQRELLKLIHARSSTIKNYIDSSNYGESVDELQDEVDVDDSNNPLPSPIGRHNTLHPIGRQNTRLHPNSLNRSNISGSSGLHESDIHRRNTSHSIFRKSTRYMPQEEITAATDADIDIILQEDVPDPSTEDREFFHRRNTTRISRSGSGTAFMHADEEEGIEDGIEMGDMRVVRNARSGNTLVVPRQSGEYARDRSPDVGPSSRLRSRSPVKFEDQGEGGSSGSLDIPRAPTVRSIPSLRSLPTQDSGASSDWRASDSREELVDRRMTLPSHPQYIGRTFRSIPRFLSQYISPRAAAIVCLSITGTITVLNIVLNIAIPQ
jgi:hypothetical protein